MTPTKKTFRTGMMLLAALVLLAALPFGARSADAPVRKTLTLTAGKADTVDLGLPVADLLVANPAIADVGTLRSSRLYVVGKAVGDTNVLAFDAAGNQLADITVRVRIDESGLKDTIKSFFPGEKIDIKTARNEIILTGQVSNPSVANKVRDLASRFVSQADKTIVDLMSVRGEQQVMLRVKIVEAKRAVLREYGIAPNYEGGSVDFTSIPGTGLAALAPFGNGILGNFGKLNMDLRGLERDGLINVLAEPNLTAISGETAGFLAGGEFPVPTGRDQDGNITLEFKQFGVSLNFTPTVLSEERISMQLSTEVSARSDEEGVTLINTRIPGLTVRRAETTVQMGSGGTLMIAGLIKSDTLESINGFPGAKDVPVLGELFKSKSFQRSESELVILVTPYIVEPFAEAAAVRSQQISPPVQGLPPAPYAPDSGAAQAVQKAALKTDAPAGRSGAATGNTRMATPRSTPGQPQAVVTPVSSRLSQSFTRNLRATYGSRVPAAASGTGYGYIVD